MSAYSPQETGAAMWSADEIEQALSVYAIRERFARVQDFDWVGDWPLKGNETGAAVLIPLVLREERLSVLLTRRTDHLHHHPGQISFPGGRIEPEDATPAAAALRETEEEIGIPVADIELLGELPPYATSTGFRVNPVVGVVQGPLDLRLDSFEVAEAFEVPLAFLMRSHNYQRHRVQRSGHVGHFYAVPYPGRFIWGATAGMLAMLAAFMRG